MVTHVCVLNKGSDYSERTKRHSLRRVIACGSSLRGDNVYLLVPPPPNTHQVVARTRGPCSNGTAYKIPNPTPFSETWKMGLSEEEEEEEHTSDDSARSRGSKASKSDTLDGEGDDESEAESLPAAPSRRRRQDGDGDGGGGVATDEVDDGKKIPRKRESVFETGSPWDRRSSQAASNLRALPEIPIRRRTTVATDSSPPSGAPGGAIAQASRIIPDLDLEKGDMMFPLDSLRGGSSGFEAVEDDEDESVGG